MTAKQATIGSIIGRKERSRDRSAGSSTKAANRARKKAICRGAISGECSSRMVGFVSALVNAPLVLHIKAASTMSSRARLADTCASAVEGLSMLDAERDTVHLA